LVDVGVLGLALSIISIILTIKFELPVLLEKKVKRDYIFQGINEYMRDVNLKISGKDAKFFSDFSTRFIDFNKFYLKYRGICDNENSPDNGKLIEDTAGHLLKRLKKKSISCCIIGDYGTGKSLLLMYLFKQLPREKYHVVLAPYRWARENTTDFDDYIFAALNYLKKESFTKNIDDETFKELVNKGKIILLIDGYDEFHQGTDRPPKEFYREKNRTNKHEKIILTSRPSAFQGAKQDFIKQSKKNRIDINWKNRVELINLEKLNIDDAKKIMILQNTPNNVIEELLSDESFKSLCGQHIHIDIILKIHDKLTSGEYTVSDIFEECIKAPFRDSTKERYDLILTAIEKIAYETYVEKKDTINIKDIKLLLDTEGPRLEDLYYLSYVGEEDQYKFTHMSFLEYFVARRLNSAIINNNGQEIREISGINLRNSVYRHEIIRRTAEIASKCNNQKYLELMDSTNQKCIRYLGLYIYTRLNESNEKDRNEAAEIFIELLEKEEDFFIKRELYISLAYVGRLEKLNEYIVMVDNDKTLCELDDKFSLGYFYKDENYAIEEGIRLLKNSNPMREFHIRFLGIHGDHRCIDVIRKYLEDDCEFIRMGAKEAIKKIEERRGNCI